MGRHALCLTLLAALAASARGEEQPPAARAAFAEALRGTKNDAERAVRLLNAARLAGTDTAVSVALLEKAVEFGLKAARAPEADRAVEEALDLLERRAPQRLDRWRARRLELAELRYRLAPAARRREAGRALLEQLLDNADRAEAAGRWSDAAGLHRRGLALAAALRDARRELLAFRGRRAEHFRDVARRIDLARKALAENPAASATRESLLVLLLAEMADPNAAAAVLAEDVSPAWRTYVPLAVKGPTALPPTGAAELGRWLAEFLAPRASRYARLGVLLAARDCYVQAISGTGTARPEQMTARLALQRLDEQIEQFAMQPGSAGAWGWAEMLRAIDPDHVKKHGIWRMESSALTVWPGPGGYLRVPATISGHYRVSVRFAHRQLRSDIRGLADRLGLSGLARGRPGMGLAFPVGDVHLAFDLRPKAGGATARLFLVDPPEGPRTGVGGPPGPPGRSGRPSRSGRSGGGDRHGSGPGGQDRPGGPFRRPWFNRPDNPRPPQSEADSSRREETIPAEKTITAEAPAMALGRTYQIDVSVFVHNGAARVAVYLDRRPLLHWTGEVARCSVPATWRHAVRPQTVLLSGALGPTQYTSVKLIPLNGRITLDG